MLGSVKKYQSVLWKVESVNSSEQNLNENIDDFLLIFSLI